MAARYRDTSAAPTNMHALSIDNALLMRLTRETREQEIEAIRAQNHLMFSILTAVVKELPQAGQDRIAEYIGFKRVI